MKIIDWYIIRKFLSTFFFAILVFAVIAVVIDYGEKADDLVRTGWNFIEIFTNYYSAFIPHIIALLFPLFVFIAVIFFTSKMATRSEIIAILASGVSFRRFLLPYFITSLLLAIGLYFASAFLVPRSEVKRAYFETNYVRINSGYYQMTEGQRSPSMYYKIDSHRYVGIRSYDTVAKSGGPVFMWDIRDAEATYNMRGQTISWDTTGSAEKKKARWRIDGAFERYIDSLDERIVVDSKKDFKFQFTPFDLRIDQFSGNVMTSPELKKYIQNEKARGGENANLFMMELYRRVATAFSVIILTMIGAIISSRKVRGGNGTHLAIGFVLAAIYVVMDRFSTVFSTKGNLDPMIAAWIPNTIFLLVAIYLYRRAPK